MRTFTLLLLLAFTACVFAQFDRCPARTCVKAGTACNVNRINNPTVECRADSYCNVTSGNFTTGIGMCVKPAQVGESCYSLQNGGHNCRDDLSCNPSSDGNSTCALKAPNYQYLYPGESCSGDLQCIVDVASGKPTVDAERDFCRSGHCKSTKDGDYCQPQLSSTPYDQCHYGKSYCSNANRCEKYIKKGGFCTLTDQTQFGCGKSDERRCMPSNAFGPEGTCQDFISRKVDEHCDTIDDCEEGLFCYQANSTLGRGKCTLPTQTATVGQACNSSASCTATNSETCICTKAAGNTGARTSVCVVNVYPKGYWKANRDADRCYRKKGCNSDTCRNEKCKSKICKVFDIAQKSPHVDIDCEGEGICNSAFALFASPIVAIVAFIAVFVL